MQEVGLQEWGVHSFLVLALKKMLFKFPARPFKGYFFVFKISANGFCFLEAFLLTMIIFCRQGRPLKTKLFGLKKST